MKLVWSRKARDECEALGRFSIERWGAQVAHRYVEDVLSAAEAIAVDPRTARLLKGAFRIKRVRLHYLIVQIDEEKDRLLLLRIIHVAQDLERYLPS